ncbi:MAG: dihydroorotate dehydrogenase electron transfer subunit [Fusobacterium sp.]|uniref:dihydroorotate dehydrogenase electron transfer subunit n=1 Tax=Fusobacterium sp. TaxID=68766 RepID=UPI0026DA9404|nr:dihydroorotate dehydrogenase electron transfer subunit [Fusobacterium sp.]MDO4690061.1 dihydroorotate dehydrogenase electron transfer subunit [Fusobacterium sp.]
MRMEDCIVEENIQIAKDIYKMRIRGNFVKECRTPGQFINIRIGDGKEHILRRPISISEIDRTNNLVTIVYRIVGEGTKFLANIKKGNEIDIMGPLGRGFDIFSLKKEQTALLIGGGIGIPPLYELAKQFNQKGVKTIHLLGFNTKEEIFYEEEFSKLGKTYISTVDGSYGIKGFITDTIKKLQEENSLNFDKYYSCGPGLMLKALIDRLGEDGYVSLENRMACGIGACYACVCKKKNKIRASINNKKVDYTRVCYDGPVYLASDVEI